MAINFESFVKWANKRFQDVIVRGDEVMINSIFTDDRKHKLYCNPFGGKQKREDGCYHCWKTGEKGTLVGLVMIVECCSYAEAKEILGGISLSDMEKKLDEFFSVETISPPILSNLRLPEETYPISDLSFFHKMTASNYLDKRKLSCDKLLYCTGGKYRKRIVIPYYDRSGSLIYFNSRHVGESKLRYLGPPKTIGIGKADVLYCPFWPPEGSKIYITEGEFDAMCLYACGLYSVACGGKLLSDKQIEMLSPYKICLALDTDSAGLEGLMGMGEKIIRKCGASKLAGYVRPPIGYKDWNCMLVRHDKNLMLSYILSCERPFDDWTLESLKLNLV